MEYQCDHYHPKNLKLCKTKVSVSCLLALYYYMAIIITLFMVGAGGYKLLQSQWAYKIFIMDGISLIVL